MRIWFKQFKDNHMIYDMEVEDNSIDTRTHKVFRAIEEACYAMDLSVPIWLDSTINDFKRYSKARFTADAFVEEIPFDYLEIHVLEED